MNIDHAILVNRTLLAAFAAATLAFLSSCGTMSPLKEPGGRSIEQSTRQFSHISVPDFRSSVSPAKAGTAPAKSYFAERVADELRSAGSFKSVSRSRKGATDSLVVDGEITRYEEGSEMARLIVGMGAGSSYLDATVIFRDSNGRELGRMTIDRNSWVLGGVLASTQTPQTFMDQAAKKIAAEAAKFSKP